MAHQTSQFIWNNCSWLWFGDLIDTRLKDIHLFRNKLKLCQHRFNIQNCFNCRGQSTLQVTFCCLRLAMITLCIAWNVFTWPRILTFNWEKVQLAQKRHKLRDEITQKSQTMKNLTISNPPMVWMLIWGLVCEWTLVGFWPLYIWVFLDFGF